MKELLQKIPAVGDAIHWDAFSDALETESRAVVVQALSETADDLRTKILRGEKPDMSPETFVANTLGVLARLQAPRLKRVVNATGIIVHTNLGRSVLAPEALEAVLAAAGGYSNLEYDLGKGQRGSRHDLISDLICEITGAQGAIAVNNNAGAVLLCLNTLAEKKEVVVSRGELIEIGGSFRIPDVMSKSGCRLVEVGTTNKTHPMDYQSAITDDTALFLKVHTSNYRIMGFTSEVKGAQLADIAHEHGLLVMEDLGSGALLHGHPAVLGDEPTVGNTLSAGIDVVTFSGDKLLGGPQAGIIVGKKDLISQIAKNPLARALRCDKMTLAALEATLRLYRDPQTAMKKIPTLKMIDASLKVMREKARRLAEKIRTQVGDRAEISVKTTTARVGGGAVPLYDIPSAAVVISPRDFSVAQLDLKMRALAVPVIGRIESDQFLLDVRTLLDGESKIIQNAVEMIFAVEKRNVSL